MSRAISKSENDNLVVFVKRDRVETVRRDLQDLGYLDRRRKFVYQDDGVLIPVTQKPPGFEICVQESPVFYRSTPPLDVALDGRIPDDLVDLVPKGWFILGDVIIVKIDPLLTKYKSAIGSTLLDIYPRCRCVLADFGIEGQLRQPKREIIAGSCSKTVHKENGVLFKLDPMEVMFSPGNLKERMRMSRLGHDEVVVDMFAGIGYFSVQMAVHARPKCIIAIELNPVAYGYLVENIRLNHVEDIVTPLLGNCEDLTPVGEADRVLMGMVGITERYLVPGIKALRPGGILHFHQTVPSWLYPRELVDVVRDSARALGREIEVLQVIKVKKYSPGVVHGVADIRIL